MVDVGILGLDTSHSEAFASILDERNDATIAAVWDGGDVRNEAYTQQFCDRFDATLCNSPSELRSLVDASMVLTVDWETHRLLAEPLLEAGVPTFIDKPIAGSIADIEAIEAAAGATPLFGGSSVPYHPDIESVRNASEQSLYCVGYNDPFYYGAHIVDIVRFIAASDWHTVSPADDPGMSVNVLFENDLYATLLLDGPREDVGFAVLNVGDHMSTTVINGGEEELGTMYHPFMDRFLDTVRGGDSQSDRVLDSARLLLAIHAALEENRPITPNSSILNEFNVTADGFTEDYRPHY